MQDIGLDTPVSIPMGGDSNALGNVDTTTYRSINIPNVLSGSLARYILLSVLQEVPGTPWHLLLMPAQAADSIPSDDTVVALLHGTAHDSIVLDVSGFTKIFVKATAGSLHAVRIGALENTRGANHGPLSSPVAIGADSKSAVLTAAGVAATNLPTMANGEVPKYILVSWDAPAQNVFFATIGLQATFHAVLNGYAHNPILLDVAGFSRMRAQLVSGADSRVRYTPLENY